MIIHNQGFIFPLITTSNFITLEKIQLPNPLMNVPGKKSIYFQGFPVIPAQAGIWIRELRLTLITGALVIALYQNIR
jgi:hypothetical protein